MPKEYSLEDSKSKSKNNATKDRYIKPLTTSTKAHQNGLKLNLDEKDSSEETQMIDVKVSNIIGKFEYYYKNRKPHQFLYELTFRKTSLQVILVLIKSRL